MTSRAAAGPVVTLVTVGPGDAMWEKFGHNMLRVEDADRGLDVCFNWGLFDFEQPNFILNFARGRMLYTMAPLRSDRTLDSYRKQNRRTTFQRLRLSPEQADALAAMCVDNFRNFPDYRYDYYRDNCSTRIRDLLQNTLGPDFGPASDHDPASPVKTYRGETLRLMHDEFWLGLGIDFLAGPSTDRPLTRWSLGFLPPVVAEMATPFADAAVEPWTSTRPPPPDAPRTTSPWLLAAGIVGAAVMLAGHRRGWRRFIGLATVYGWWLAAGFGGAFMLYMWTATDHVNTYANQNLWHFSPLAWPALGLHLFRRRAATVWFTRALVGLAVVGCVVWVVGKTIGGPIAQANGNFVLLSLPLNLAAAWATRTTALTKPAAADEVSA